MFVLGQPEGGGILARRASGTINRQRLILHLRSGANISPSKEYETQSPFTVPPPLPFFSHVQPPNKHSSKRNIKPQTGSCTRLNANTHNHSFRNVLFLSVSAFPDTHESPHTLCPPLHSRPCRRDRHLCAHTSRRAPTPPLTFHSKVIVNLLLFVDV